MGRTVDVPCQLRIPTRGSCRYDSQHRDVVMYPLRRTVMVPDTCPIFFVGAGLMVAPYFLDF